MTPDQAAAKLQIEERGLKLLKLCEEKPEVMRAITALQSGFKPADVAEMFGLDYDPEADQSHANTEGAINVWQCRTDRCRQKGRVSTATEPPKCPSCHKTMDYEMSVDHPEEISHMKRTFVPDPGLSDPLARTDKTKAPDFAMGEFDD